MAAIKTDVRLVLTSAPLSLEERYGRFKGAASTQPSFGLVCLAASALQTGAEVAIVEASARNLSPAETLDEALAFRPHIIGITATTMGIDAAGQLAADIKARAPETAVLVGGPHVTALPGETLTSWPDFDVAVLQEGEATLAEILRRFADEGRLPRGIDGTAERSDGNVMVNPARPMIEDLDGLPLPAWRLLNGFPVAFRPTPSRIRQWPCASVVLTRGCPNTCTFCDRSVFGRACRAYSPAYAVEMIRDLRMNFGVREVLIEDDTFVISKARVREFCERLIAASLGVTWSCLGRADRVDPELLALMRKAGCWHIAYGIESGSEEILSAVNKRVNLDQVRQAVEWSARAGLRTKGFFMVGFPGETAVTLRATAELAMSLPLDDISVMQLSPFPGSELHARAAEFGTVTGDWRSMNTINPVFVPKGLTAGDLEKARDRLIGRFYRRPRVVLRQLTHLLRSPRAAAAALAGLPAFLRLIGRDTCI